MNKKQKKMIGIGAAIAIVLILIVVFSGGKSSSNAGIVPVTLTEKEKYARFEAEVACEMVDILKDADTSETFMQDTLKVLEDVSAKYGYTMSEIEANKAKYENDAEFQGMARDYVLEICPEIAAEMQNSN